jgi:hypothetical protein
MTETEIEEKILGLRSELKTDRLDMSFGEIMNIYEDGDLIITPEYQRAYRWKDIQKTRFIESILLGIPIPPIFVAEDNSGKWELVDGLQRISTILSFFGILKNDIDKKNKFKLIETDLTEDCFKGVDIEQLSVKLKNTIKRAVCRVEILRWDSKFDMRYELFNRLNTGASPLTPQEIRNCVFTGSFNNLIQGLAQNEIFIKLINPTEKQQEEMFLEELVLRFIAFKYEYNNLIIKVSIQGFLSDFMKGISKKNIDVNYNELEQSFLQTIDLLNNVYGSSIFRAKNGLFTPNIYDTVMYITDKYYSQNIKDLEYFKKKIEILLDDEDYKKASGASTYASKRMQLKIKRAKEIFDDDQ